MSTPEQEHGKTVTSRRISTVAFSVGAVVLALLIACVASIWASSLPDGLTFVAEESGFAAAEQPSALAGSPFAGYGLFLVEDPWLSVAIAGAVGCGVTFGLAWVVGRVAKRRRVEA